MSLYSLFFKRLFDLIISLLALPFVVLMIIVIGPLIWLEDRGPIFYCGERIGYLGKPFKMIKFRSMKVNAPDIRNSDGSTFNSDKDARVTRIGKIMRKTSIDEIPQFINTLKGDMSIVGPRAHVLSKGKTFASLPADRKKRARVKPGITGYTAAYYRNSITSEEKMKYDLYYVDNVSFLLDVKIFIKTIKTVLLRENINQDSQ